MAILGVDLYGDGTVFPQLGSFWRTNSRALWQQKPSLCAIGSRSSVLEQCP